MASSQVDDLPAKEVIDQADELSQVCPVTEEKLPASVDAEGVVHDETDKEQEKTEELNSKEEVVKDENTEEKESGSPIFGEDEQGATFDEDEVEAGQDEMI